MQNWLEKKTFCCLLSALVCALLAPSGLSSSGWAQPRIPDNSGPRPAEVGPSFVFARERGPAFDSDFLRGNRSLALVLENDTPTQNFNEAVALASREAEKRGVTTVLLASNPDPARFPSAPAPILTLRDDSKALAHAYNAPTFLLLDRAGWIRRAVPLPPVTQDPNSLTLRTLLESARDLTPPLRVGAPAPDFGFRDARGVWRRVSDLRGQSNLVLTFFPKCFTGRCKSHLSSLRDAFPEISKTQTEIWAVSSDPASGEAGQIAFSQSLGLPFPLLPDTNRNISLLYRAVELSSQLPRRQTILIDKNGIVREIDTQVVADSHGGDVLRKLATF